MDNLTHSLVGVVLAKSGLERLSPYATAVCVLAANAPDADILTALWGRWFSLEHHRGITHSIVGVIAIGFLLPLFFYFGDRAIAAWRKREPRVKLKGLLIASLIATASHPILDWTNSYGVRPFLPFNEQWFYGDLVFIFDPWLWLVLGGAGFLLTANTRGKFALWTVIGSVTTFLLLLLTILSAMVSPSRREIYIPLASKMIWIISIVAIILLYRSNAAQKWGSKIALAALAFMVLYWGSLSFIHATVINKVENEAANIASTNGEKINRVAAMPTVANPLRWQGMAETEKAVYRFDTIVTKEKQEDRIIRYEKPSGQATVTVEKAAQDYRVKTFLRFARFPVVKVEGDCLSDLLVQFADLRYTEPSREERRGNFSINVPLECDTLGQK
jgi:inner membrane protein